MRILELVDLNLKDNCIIVKLTIDETVGYFFFVDMGTYEHLFTKILIVYIELDDLYMQ